jgi:hypothetical protein
LSDKKSEGVLVVVHGNVPEQIAQSISHQSGLPIALDLLPVGTRDSRVVSFAECGLVTRRSVQESFFDPNAEQSVAVHEVWVRDEIHAEVVQNRSPDVTAVCVPQPRLVVPSTSRVRESGFLFVGDCANPSVLRCAEWAARIVQEARQRPGVSLYLDLVADQSRFRGEALAASQVVRVWPSLPALFQSEGLPRAALIPLIAGDEPLIQDFLELSRRGITLITTPLGVAAAGLPKQTEVVVGETTQELIQAVRKIAERPMLSTSSDVLSQPNDETGSADLSQRTFRMLQRRMSTPPVTVVLHAARVRHPAVGELRPSEVLCAQNHPCHQLVVVHGDTVVGPCVSDEINPILVPTDESFDAVFRTALSLNGSADLVFLSSALRVSDPSVLMNLFRASYSAPDIAGCTGLILRSSGRVVSCGYDLVEGGALWPRGIGVERESRALRVRSEVAAVDGAFLYVRRDCIERFQKERRTNQAFRAWQDVSKILGWRLIACPDACATLRSDGARKQLGSQIDRLKERTPPGWDAWFPG